MIGELAVKKAKESIRLARGGKDGELLMDCLHTGMNLLFNEASGWLGWGDETINRRSVCSRTCNDGQCGSIGKDNTVEANNRNVEGRKVCTEACADTAVMIGAERGDFAENGRLFRQYEVIVQVNGVDKLSANGLTNLHGKPVVDLYGKRGADRESNSGHLAACSYRKDKQEESETDTAPGHLDLIVPFQAECQMKGLTQEESRGV
jgi:hypothetical protein